MDERVKRVVVFLTVRVGWSTEGTPARRCTADPIQVPVETAVPRKQLSKPKRRFSVRPVYPPVEEQGRYQRVRPVAPTAVGGVPTTYPPHS